MDGCRPLEVGTELLVHHVTQDDGSVDARLYYPESTVPQGFPLEGEELTDWIVTVVEVSDDGTEAKVVPV